MSAEISVRTVRREARPPPTPWYFSALQDGNNIMMGHRRLTFARGTCFEDNSQRTPVSREQRRAVPNRMESIMPATRTDGDTRFLDPAIFATVDNLELLARFIVEGFMIGLHRSPYHGFSVEFSSYRKYSPGDEPRYVDWKLFGKTDRLYVKQFEENTNLVCTLCVDCSGSMKVGDQHLTKFKYATSLAAALAYLLLKQGDAVGLVAFSEREVEVVRPRSRTNHCAAVVDAPICSGALNISLPMPNNR